MEFEGNHNDNQLWHFSFETFSETELTPTHGLPNEYEFDMLSLGRTKIWFFTENPPQDAPSGDWMWFFHNLPHTLYPLSKEAFEFIEIPTKQILLQKEILNWYNRNCIDTEEEARMYHYGGSPADANCWNIYSPIQQVFYKREINASTETHLWCYNFFVYQNQVHIRLFRTSRENFETISIEEHLVDLEWFKEQTYDFSIRWLNALKERLEAAKTFDWTLHQKAHEITIAPLHEKHLDVVITEKQQQYKPEKLFTPIEFDWIRWAYLLKDHIV